MGAGDREKIGKVILGAVKGDIHDVGKNLVGIMLRGASFEVTDIGDNASAEKFVDALLSAKARLASLQEHRTWLLPELHPLFELTSVRCKRS